MLPTRAACRAAALDRVVRRRGVLLTTYGMVLHNAEALGSHSAHDPDEGPMWDVMICGGHTTEGVSCGRQVWYGPAGGQASSWQLAR